jgi:hypothetical protein
MDFARIQLEVQLEVQLNLLGTFHATYVNNMKADEVQCRDYNIQIYKYNLSHVDSLKQMKSLL